MTLIRISIFTIILLCFSVFALADTVYFDFSPLDNVVGSDSFKVTVNYDLDGIDESAFLIRPNSTLGILEIYNSSTNSWILATDGWAKMPPLSHEVTLRLKGFTSDSLDLSFTILNSKTGMTYKTPTHKIWNKSLTSSYAERLNANLLAVPESTETTEPVVDLTLPDKNIVNHSVNDKLPLLLLFGVSLVIIIAYAFFRNRKSRSIN